MKITDVTVTVFEWDGVPDLNFHGLKPAKCNQGLVRIVTDEGFEGHAFLGKVMEPALADAEKLCRFLKPLLVGQNPLDRERLSQALLRRYQFTGMLSVGALDIALWDLVGKIAGLPIHQLLGSFRSEIPAYVSSDHLPSPEAYADEAVKYRDLGYAGYKIHPPSEWRADIEVCEAVRKAVGDEFTLMLDSTWVYRYEEALRVGRAIEEMGYYWYEDPLEGHDFYNYRKLKEKLDIPIMATERPAYGLAGYAIWITEKATDFLRGDVAIKGGISTLMKTAHLAEAFGMRYEVHAGGNSLYNLANLHIEMAIPNTQFHEILLPAECATYAVHNEIVVDANGMIAAPTGPGLGAEIDFEMIERRKLAVFE